MKGSYRIMLDSARAATLYFWALLTAELF